MMQPRPSRKGYTVSYVDGRPMTLLAVVLWVVIAAFVLGVACGCFWCLLGR